MSIDISELVVEFRCGGVSVTRHALNDRIELARLRWRVSQKEDHVQLLRRAG